MVKGKPRPFASVSYPGPAHRGKGGNRQIDQETQEKAAFAQKRRMAWA